jgi:hypothetical protein
LIGCSGKPLVPDPFAVGIFGCAFGLAVLAILAIFATLAILLLGFIPIVVVI